MTWEPYPNDGKDTHSRMVNAMATSSQPYVVACAELADEMVEETIALYDRSDEHTLLLIGREAIATSTANGYNKSTPLERIALCHSELSEALEAYRIGKKDYYEVDGKPEGVGAELADTIIRICELATFLDIDLDPILSAKMAYNKIRSDVPVRGGEKSI